MNFTHHCTACDRTQLIFLSMVTGVSDDSLDFTCWCGADQSAPMRQGTRIAA